MAALALYELERPALKAFTEELKQTMLADDKRGLCDLLELGDALTEKVAASGRIVDLFLLPEDDAQVVPLLSSLRRISRKRAMSKVFTSTHPSLEGRLRAYDVLRDDKKISHSIDRLLNPNRLPWYLRRAGATCGWLANDERLELTSSVSKLKPSLTPELSEWLQGLDEVEGDVVAHDNM
jgi:hypothetical protein